MKKAKKDVQAEAAEAVALLTGGVELDLPRLTRKHTGTVLFCTVEHTPENRVRLRCSESQLPQSRQAGVAPVLASAEDEALGDADGDEDQDDEEGDDEARDEDLDGVDGVDGSDDDDLDDDDGSDEDETDDEPRGRVNWCGNASGGFLHPLADGDEFPVGVRAASMNVA